jgi:hypothetical protein
MALQRAGLGCSLPSCSREDAREATPASSGARFQTFHQFLAQQTTSRGVDELAVPERSFAISATYSSVSPSISLIVNQFAHGVHLKSA